MVLLGVLKLKWRLNNVSNDKIYTDIFKGVDQVLDKESSYPPLKIRNKVNTMEYKREYEASYSSRSKEDQIKYMQESIDGYNKEIDQIKSLIEAIKNSPFNIGDVVITKTAGNGIVQQFEFIATNRSASTDSIQVMLRVNTQHGSVSIPVTDAIPYTQAGKLLHGKNK